VARVPEAIAGRAERYGRGIADTAHVPAAVVRLIVDLIAVDTRPRLPEEDDTKTVIAGVTLPRQAAGCRQSEVSVPLVLATLAEINKF
jgi:HPr kinase/phosphorylase